MKNIKKTILLIIILCSQYIAFGQDDPIILAYKTDVIAKLIPGHWKILSITEGDLNNDGRNDVAFIIENTNPKNIKLNESSIGRSTINLNPRILGIYFKNRKGLLIKKLQSNSFIPLQDSPTMDEPFDGIKILEDGTLQIDFKFWSSAGSWSMSNHSYNFQYKKRKFQLIGYQSSTQHRGTGESKDCHINFLTDEMRIFETIIDDNDVRNTSEETKSFKLDSLKTIQALQKPFQWEFCGFYI